MTTTATAIDREALILDNLHLAYWLARKLHRRWPHVNRLPVEDAEGAALLGLVRAARCFDPDYGTRFSTYAYRGITTAIKEAARKSCVVSLPSQFAEVRRGDLPEDMAAAAARVEAPVASLSRCYDDGERPVLDLAARDDGAAGDIERREAEEKVARLLAALPERQRRVVRAVYLEGRTLESIGAEIGVSKERVRQIRNQGVRLMREVGRG